MLSDTSQSQRQILCESTHKRYLVNFTETGKQNGGCQGLGEGGDGELMFKGYGVSVLQEEEVLETCGTAM